MLFGYLAWVVSLQSPQATPLEELLRGASAKLKSVKVNEQPRFTLYTVDQCILHSSSPRRWKAVRPKLKQHLMQGQFKEAAVLMEALVPYVPTTMPNGLYNNDSRIGWQAETAHYFQIGGDYAAALRNVNQALSKSPSAKSVNMGLFGHYLAALIRSEINRYSGKVKAVDDDSKLCWKYWPSCTQDGYDDFTVNHAIAVATAKPKDQVEKALWELVRKGTVPSIEPGYRAVDVTRPALMALGEFYARTSKVENAKLVFAKIATEGNSELGITARSRLKAISAAKRVGGR